MTVRHSLGAVALWLAVCLPGCEPREALAEATPVSLGATAAKASAARERAGPAHPRATLDDIHAALAAGQPERAAADLVELLADPGLDATTLEAAGRAAELSGDPNARRLALRRRLERDERPALPLQLALAQVLLELDEASDAIALYESLLPALAGQDGLHAVPLLEGLARARDSLGDHEGALALRERAAGLLDTHREQLGRAWDASLAGLTHSYSATRRERDLARLSAELQAAPDEADHARASSLAATRGLLLERAGRHGEALALLEPAVASLSGLVEPTHPDLALARRRLATSRAATGDAGRARDELAALSADLRAAAPPGPALWRTEADRASLALAAGEALDAMTLDADRVAETAALLPASHPLRLAALGDLCWSLAAAADAAERDESDATRLAAADATRLTSAAAALRESTAALLERLAGRLPAQREALLAEADAQLALLAALDLARDAEPTATWTLLELRHARAGAATIQAGSAADDPELADRRAHLRASERRLEQLLVGGRHAELPAAVAACDAAEAALDLALERRGLGAVPIDRASVAQALPAATVLVSLDVLGAGAPATSLDAPRLLAHVLTGDGRLTRHLLAPLTEIQAAADAWLAAGAPLAGESHQRLVELLVAPLTARTAAASSWWLRGTTGLPSLPLEAFAGGVRLSELPHLGAALAPRPPWNLPARLVDAVQPDLEGAPGADALRGAAGRTPALPVQLSAASRQATTDLGALVSDIERRHGPRGGAPVQRISGADVTRATLGRLVAEARDVLLVLPAWDAPDREPTPATLTPSRSSDRDGRRSDAGLACGLALAGGLRPRDDLGRVPGLATLDDLSRWHLLAADLVCCPTPDDELPGLAEAFVRAGARAVLTPRWPSSSAARAQLLDEFLRRHWEQGLPARQALREAQGALLAAGQSARDVLGWRLLGQP